MSNTKRHKLESKWKRGVLNKVPQSVQNKWDRHNNDWGEFRALKKELVEKIMKKEEKLWDTTQNLDSEQS